MEPMEISSTSSSDESKPDTEVVNDNDAVIVVNVHDSLVVNENEDDSMVNVNGDKNGSLTSTFTSSVTNSNDSMADRKKELKRKKSCLLNTKNYLMNSLLHFRERDKILGQLSKQKTVDKSSRNFYHGRLYNYVLPPPNSLQAQKSNSLKCQVGIVKLQVKVGIKG